MEGERKGANLLETGDLAGLQGGGIQHQHRTQAEDVPEQLVVLGAEKAVSSGPRGTAPRMPPPRLPAHLKVVVHPRTQRILEGSVDPAPSPAVHVEHLEAEADGLICKMGVIMELEQEWEQLSRVRSSFLCVLLDHVVLSATCSEGSRTFFPSSLLLSPAPLPPTSVPLPGLLRRAHSVLPELSPSALVTAVRVYGEKLYCPPFRPC